MFPVSVFPKIRFPENTTLRLEVDCAECRYRGEAKCVPVIVDRKAKQTRRAGKEKRGEA